MSTEITSADIVMNGYENFEELISGICNAARVFQMDFVKYRQVCM